MSEDLISRITLECLTNEKFQSKYSETKTDLFKKNKKFYKKRIYDLAKKILNEEDTTILPTDILRIFDIYTRTCIDYFKIIDKTDILQGEYEPDAIQESVAVVLNEGENTIIHNNTDNLLMRSIKYDKTTSLDKIVKRTMIKKEKETIPLPKKRKVNLKDPALKNKGIGEKNNLHNNYDGKNKKENDKETTENEKKSNNREDAENKKDTENKKDAENKKDTEKSTQNDQIKM